MYVACGRYRHGDVDYHSRCPVRDENSYLSNSDGSNV